MPDNRQINNAVPILKLSLTRFGITHPQVLLGLTLLKFSGKRAPSNTALLKQQDLNPLATIINLKSSLRKFEIFKNILKITHPFFYCVVSLISKQ